MVEEQHVDVVVIGFGAVGATAAFAAAEAGAQVTILERKPSPSFVRIARPLRRRRAADRLSLPANGIELKNRCDVHDLVVEGGRRSGL
ncbi:FAD-dependent oxidoreductase [Rhodococcus sp. IEGM 1366]|uniref:FAD-dependent oxidoreductase n=1 Tax=Rhodococcus sp. IEGM 1366 TaxID=3082223 RepID=UPI002954DD33|nr:FAD-dependent oxidoreductase [Rhodococcus sp. IEGM 1366]MDV8071045.1 FAD-dependent oxidoreductase [Rhodococcus sp. IEGM 1366]